MKLWIASLCLVFGLGSAFCQEVRSEQDEKMSRFDPSQHLWFRKVPDEVKFLRLRFSEAGGSAVQD